MRIIEENCNRCGKCEVECHRNAIIKNQSGQYIINERLCNGCIGLFDIQCAKSCPCGCIVKILPGSKVERIIFDNVIRLRPDHLLHVIAIIGAGNNNRYINGREWGVLRDLIAKAYLDPELEIRIVPTFDDVCVGCKSKKDPKHVELLTWEDGKTLEMLKYCYGDVVKFWEAVGTARKNITAQYLKSIRKPDVFIEDFLNFNIAGTVNHSKSM